MSLTTWLESLTRELTPHFKPGLLQRDSTVFRFEFSHADTFFLLVTPNSFSFSTSQPKPPTLILFLDSHETCRDLLAGRMDGMEAFMQGRYRANGNIVLSQLLLYTFKADSPTIAYEVQD